MNKANLEIQRNKLRSKRLKNLQLMLSEVTTFREKVERLTHWATLRQHSRLTSEFIETLCRDEIKRDRKDTELLVKIRQINEEIERQSNLSVEELEDSEKDKTPEVQEAQDSDSD